MLLLDSKRDRYGEHQNGKGQKGIQYMAMKFGSPPDIGDVGVTLVTRWGDERCAGQKGDWGDWGDG